MVSVYWIIPCWVDRLLDTLSSNECSPECYSTSKPSGQSNIELSFRKSRTCCNFLFLGPVFSFMLWQCCACGLIWFRHKNNLVRIGRGSFFCLTSFCSQTQLGNLPMSCQKYLVLLSLTRWKSPGVPIVLKHLLLLHSHDCKLSQRFIKNIQWTRTYKCRNIISSTTLRGTELIYM